MGLGLANPNPNPNPNPKTLTLTLTLAQVSSQHGRAIGPPTTALSDAIATAVRARVRVKGYG